MGVRGTPSKHVTAFEGLTAASIPTLAFCSFSSLFRIVWYSGGAFPDAQSYYCVSRHQDHWLFTSLGNHYGAMSFVRKGKGDWKTAHRDIALRILLTAAAT